MMQTITEFAVKKSPFIKKIVVDFMREGKADAKRDVVIQIKYVEIDYVVAKYDFMREKLPPVTKELTRCKTDFVLNSKPLMTKIVPDKESSQSILKAVDVKG